MPLSDCMNKAIQRGIENVNEKISELCTSQTKKPLFKRFVWHEIKERVEIPEK